MPLESLTEPFVTLRKWTPEHLAEDIAHLNAGILDLSSFQHGYQKHDHAVQIEVRSHDGEKPEDMSDEEWHSKGTLKAIRRSGNLRTDTGGDWQAAAMGNAASGLSGTGTTAPTSTTITLDGVGAPGSTSAYNGQIVICGGVFGICLSNTNVSSPVVTIDGWHPLNNPAGTGSTPSAGLWEIVPGQAPAMWIALSNDATAPATTDTSLASEITTNGLARALAAYAHTAVSGGTTTTVTSTYTLSKTFSATGTQSAQKAGVFNASSSGKMALENTFTSVSCVNGDTVAVTWTINC